MRHAHWLVWLAVLGCSGTPPTIPAHSPVPTPVTADGLHNVFKLTDRVFSGSSPEGDAGFESLHKLGVKTIISVDGAKPDVAVAERHGLRYVHLPVGYDGISSDRVLQLAKAVRDLPGPVYVHCHHGMHRGPAAAAAALRCLDPAWTPERAGEWLRAAGIDPKYTGLTALPNAITPPTSAELDRLPNDFPSSVPVGNLTTLMVEIDARWDHLKLAKAAGWGVPKAHPDIDPPHEAVQLGELFRESARLEAVKKRGEGFVLLFAEAEIAVKELEAKLRAKDGPAATAAFTRLQAGCASCHTTHRDRPAK